MMQGKAKEAFEHVKALESEVEHWKHEKDREIRLLQETIKGLKAEKDQAEDQRDDLVSKLEKWEELGSILSLLIRPPPMATTGSTSMHIKNQDVVVDITNDGETFREFSTQNQRGQLMYVLCADLKGGPSSSSEMLAAMVEHGWVMSKESFSPRIGDLVKEGSVVSEGKTNAVTYRVPGKLKVRVDGKEVGF